MEDAREAAIGYWLDERLEGLGIVSRATRELLRLSFVELGMNRVVIRCAAENARSRAIPERLGFNLEATLPGQEMGGRDQLVYVIHLADWEVRD